MRLIKLLCLLIVGFIPFSVAGWKYQNTISDKDFQYKIVSDHEVVVTYVFKKGKVIVPETIVAEGISYKVVGIGDYAFDHDYNIKSIILPNTIKYLENGVFSHSDIKQIVLPNSITRIGKDIFYECRKLESVIFPDSAIYNSNTIYDWTFNGCYKLKEIRGHNVVLPEYLEKPLTSKYAVHIPFVKTHKQEINQLVLENSKKREYADALKRKKVQKIHQEATVVNRQICTDKHDGFKYQLVEYSDKLFSVENSDGLEIIPRTAENINYRNHRFIVKTSKGYALYDDKGQIVIPFGKYWNMDFGKVKGSSISGSDIDFVYVNSPQDFKYSGICDMETGREVITPRKYYFVIPAMNAGHKYCIVKDGAGMYGVTNWDGNLSFLCEFVKFRIEPEYLCLYTDSKTFIKAPYSYFEGDGYHATLLFDKHNDSNNKNLSTTQSDRLYHISTIIPTSSNENENENGILFQCSATSQDSYNSLNDYLLKEFNRVMEVHKQYMEKYNGAFIMAIPDQKDKFWLYIGTTGNIKPSDITLKVIRNGLSIISTPLSSFNLIHGTVITPSEYIPGDKIVLLYNGKEYRKETIPLANSPEYAKFCLSRTQAIINISSLILSNNNSNIKSYQSNNVSNIADTDCSFCHGTGLSPVKTSVAKYGNINISEYKCKTCGDWDMHYHKLCPSCGGSGKKY